MARGSLAALDEWDDLAGKPKLGITEPHRHWLRAVLEAAEPDDAWSRKVRAARREADPARRQATLEALAESANVEKVPIRALTRLASPAKYAGGNALRPTHAVKLLRRAQARYPADFWVNEDLGKLLQEVTPPQRDEAVRFLTAAVALRPQSPGAYLNLGVALRDKGKVEEAIACYQKAIALDPKYATAHKNLGYALADKGRTEEAIAALRAAIQLDPKDASTHSNLGAALATLRKVNAAIVSFRQALALDPKCALAHYNLGKALKDKGQVDEAIASFRQAIALDPKSAPAHCNLGNALKDKGQLDEAIECYKRAIASDSMLAQARNGLGYALMDKGKVEEAIGCFRKATQLDPTYLQAQTGLGRALMIQGQLGEARKVLRRCLALLPANHPWHVGISGLLRQCQRWLDVEGKLEAFLAGKGAPADAASQLLMAVVAQRPANKCPRTAALLYRDAFARHPQLAPTHRYHAACCAALAGCGQGNDASRLGPSARLVWRQQALAWLQADLAARREQAKAGLPALKSWLHDPDLAGVRDLNQLAGLSPEECEAWLRFWVEVARTLQRTD
jgi:tetratricopeptide (TPR) repeat protein